MEPVGGTASSIVPPAASQLPQAPPLRPPEFFKLFEELRDLDSLPPPPLPSTAGSSYSLLGIECQGQPGHACRPFVPPLSQFSVEQLYDEKAFQAAAAQEGAVVRVTPKGELKRLSCELRSHIQMVARALAEEALGLGVMQDDTSAATAVSVGSQYIPGSTIRLPTKEPKSFLISKRAELIQLNMMHLLARLREVEAWHRLEKAASAGQWTDTAVLLPSGVSDAGRGRNEEASALLERARERLKAAMGSQ